MIPLTFRDRKPSIDEPILHIPPRICMEGICEEPQHMDGLCKTHYEQSKCGHNNSDKIGLGMSLCLDCGLEFDSVSKDSGQDR